MTGHAGRITGCRTPASGPQIFAMCPLLQMLIARSQRSSDDRTRQLESDQTPASGHFQKGSKREISRPDASSHARSDTPCVRSLNVSSVRLTSAYVSTDRTQTMSVRSVYTPASGHSVNPCLFCIGRRWHRQTVRTLRADTPPVKFRTFAPKCYT